MSIVLPYIQGPVLPCPLSGAMMEFEEADVANALNFFPYKPLTLTSKEAEGQNRAGVAVWGLLPSFSVSRSERSDSERSGTAAAPPAFLGAGWGTICQSPVLIGIAQVAVPVSGEESSQLASVCSRWCQCCM